MRQNIHIRSILMPILNLFVDFYFQCRKMGNPLRSWMFMILKVRVLHLPCTMSTRFFFTMLGWMTMLFHFKLFPLSCIFILFLWWNLLVNSSICWIINVNGIFKEMASLLEYKKHNFKEIRWKVSLIYADQIISLPALSNWKRGDTILNLQKIYFLRV